MPFEQKEILALIIADPAKAKTKILVALQATGMHMVEAAKRLGCDNSTLLRWIDRLGMKRDVERMRARAEREGWHHKKHGGRPKGTTVANGATAPRGSKASDRSDAAPKTSG